VVADQKNSEAYEFIEEISEKRLDLSYQILFPNAYAVPFLVQHRLYC